MLKKEGRFGKSLLEPVSIRRPSDSYEEFAWLFDLDGEMENNFEMDDDISNYTYQAKVTRGLITRKNINYDPLYGREDSYFVHFRCDNDEVSFIRITDEILWHRHVESADQDSGLSILDLQDADKGVLTVESVEEHRGQTRIFCQLRDIA